MCYPCHQELYIKFLMLLMTSSRTSSIMAEEKSKWSCITVSGDVTAFHLIVIPVRAVLFIIVCEHYIFEEKGTWRSC